MEIKKAEQILRNLFNLDYEAEYKERLDALRIIEQHSNELEIWARAQKGFVYGKQILKIAALKELELTFAGKKKSLRIAREARLAFIQTPYDTLFTNVHKYHED